MDIERRMLSPKGDSGRFFNSLLDTLAAEERPGLDKRIRVSLHGLANLVRRWEAEG